MMRKKNPKISLIIGLVLGLLSLSIILISLFLNMNPIEKIIFSIISIISSFLGGVLFYVGFLGLEVKK